MLGGDVTWTLGVAVRRFAGVVRSGGGAGPAPRDPLPVWRGGRAAALALLVLPLLAAASLSGQDAPQPGAPHADAAAVPDSAELLDGAQDAQRRFESVRRRYMSETLGWGSGPCDDQVGRMCWRREEGSLWEPEAEEPEVVEARDSLLASLARVGAALPGDEWVLGQRVWYLLEADRAIEAETLARRCGGAPGWWCAALEGLALHVEGHYPAAEEAFDRALATMDPAQARHWDQVRPLLDGDARHALEDAADRSSQDGDAMVRRLWQLSDPLELVPGNDRRTEHLARRTVIRIRADARNPHGIGWGSDLAELLLRYGWEVGWERLPPVTGDPFGSPGVVGHEHPDSRGYMPPGRVLSDPAAAAAEDWTPTFSYARSTYAPAYAPVILPMRSRIVVLTRGERALVTATFDLPEDTTLRGRRGVRSEHRPPPVFRDLPVQAGLFLNDVHDGTVRAVKAEGESRGVVTMEVPAGSYWASVEVLDPEAGRAGRFREGVPIPDVAPRAARLSDLLLVEPGPKPETVRKALARLQLDDVVESGQRILVAWEIWGLGWRDEVLEYRLSVDEEGGGFFHRAGELLGLVDREDPRILAWAEAGPSAPGPSFRSVFMELPELDPGSYVLRLQLVTPGRSPMVTERRLQVVSRQHGGTAGRR